MEGGYAAMLTSSGQAANFYAIMNIAEAGDHIVCSSAVYGGTYNLYAHTIRKMGISATFIDPDCSIEELNAALEALEEAAAPYVALVVEFYEEVEDNDFYVEEALAYIENKTSAILASISATVSSIVATTLASNSTK